MAVAFAFLSVILAGDLLLQPAHTPQPEMLPSTHPDDRREEQALLRRQPPGPPRLHPRPVRRPHLPRSPFNSRQDYNVLFAEKDGNRSSAQITAFKDTSEWNEEAARSYEEVIEQGGRVADAMRAFRTLLGGSDMLAYLAMMAPRLIELR